MSYTLIIRIRCHAIAERIEVLLAESVWPYIKTPGTPLQGWHIGVPGSGRLWLTMTDGGMIGVSITYSGYDYQFFKVDLNNYDPAIHKAIKCLKRQMSQQGIEWVSI